MRVRFAILALLLASPAFAGEPIAPVHSGASATKARDIHGFALGMPIREARKRFSVTYTQGNQIQGKLGNIDLTFEVCPSGAINFIESSQPLGQFMVDKKFLEALDAKLLAKYGRPAGGTADNLQWGLIEPVRYTTGEVRNFNTNWMTAQVMDDSGDGQGVTLNLTMLDFRICWAEYEKANRTPTDKASETVRF